MNDILPNYNFEKYKNRLLPIAYNLLGNVADAEDVLQEVWIKWVKMDVSQVQNPWTYLKKSVINTAINLKQGQKKKLKTYPGNWLPEPLANHSFKEVYAQADREYVLSYSLMVLLENLNPKERAVFILKESFDYAHTEIADALEITPESSRQLLKRAKTKLEQANPQAQIEKKQMETLLQTFLTALQDNDLQKLEKLLSEEIKLTSDGGGKAKAAINVLAGKNHVIRFLAGIYEKYYRHYTHEISLVNNQLAIIFKNEDQQIMNCWILESFDNQLSKCYFVLNPDKLMHL